VGYWWASNVIRKIILHLVVVRVITGHTGCGFSELLTFITPSSRAVDGWTVGEIERTSNI
jgi:hypothetical protein